MNKREGVGRQDSVVEIPEEGRERAIDGMEENREESVVYGQLVP